jgi:hypothetical protein
MKRLSALLFLVALFLVQGVVALTGPFARATPADPVSSVNITTQQPIGGVVAIPNFWSNQDAVAFGSVLFDSAGDKVGYIIQVPKAGNIRKIGIRIAAVTTATSLDVRVETIDDSAAPSRPSGTLWGTDTTSTLDFTQVTANTWREVTLTSDAVVGENDFIAIVFAPQGTPNYRINENDDFPFQFPYKAYFDGAAWRFFKVSPYVSLEYSDGTYAPGFGIYPISGHSNAAYGSNDSPDEKGAMFKLPFSAHLVGVYGMLGHQEHGDFDLRFYDGPTDTVGSLLLAVKGRRHFRGIGSYIYRFSAVTLLSDTWYRITVQAKGTSPGNRTAMSVFTVNAASIMDSFDLGANFILTTRVDGGPWTNMSTQRPFITLLLDQIGGLPGLRAAAEPRR